MPNFYSNLRHTNKEPRSRFYPTQGSDSASQPQIPSAPQPPAAPPELPAVPPQSPSAAPAPQQKIAPAIPEPPVLSPSPVLPERQNPERKRRAEMPYFEHRYPFLLQRLYDTAAAMIDTYSGHDFLYDAYPDYLSLRLMRDRMLRENPELTGEFLQAGCPLMWLELLADTVISERLCQKRCRLTAGR